ncbi:2810_t:CDS:1, partial [Funneliformis caledonium]
LLKVPSLCLRRILILSSSLKPRITSDSKGALLRYISSFTM